MTDTLRDEFAEADSPAFPRNYNYAGHNGMSLRDYFAAKANEEDIRKNTYRDNGPILTRSREEAKFAYADAMLAARKVTP